MMVDLAGQVHGAGGGHAGGGGRVYRHLLRWKLIWLILPTVGLIFATQTMYRLYLGVEQVKLVEILVPFLFLLIGTVGAGEAFVGAITLGEDAIEMTSLLGSQRLAFNDIRGRRVWVGRTRFLVLEQASNGRQSFRFAQKAYDFDEHFYVWLREIPDLDR